MRVPQILVVSRSVIHVTPPFHAEYLPDWIVGNLAQWIAMLGNVALKSAGL